MLELPIGTRRKTGDKYGSEGYWVEHTTKECRLTGIYDDPVPSGPSKFSTETPDGHVRAVWIYTGKEKPSEAEIEKIIEEHGGKWGTKEGEK